MSVTRLDAKFAVALGSRGFGPGGTGLPKLPEKPLPRSIRDGEIELGRAANGDAVGVNLGKLIEGRLVIQGNSGAGKSMLLRRLFEQAFGRVQQLLIDPDGEFSTLAEKFDVAIFDAAELLRVGGRSFALHVREHRYSAVLDLSDATSEQRLAIVADLTSGLVEAPAEHWHPLLVHVDEAQSFAPYYDTGDVETETRKRAIAALADLMGRGRKRGIAGVIATQRLAETAKAVVSKATNIIVGRTIFDRDLERSGASLGYTAGHSKTLRTLADGEFICLGPALAGPTRLRFRAGPVQSRHKGEAPRISAPPAISAAHSRELLGQIASAADGPPETASPPPAPTARGRHGRGWTEREDAIIRDGYARQLTMGAIATALVQAGFRQRSLGGISTRGQALGLTSSRTYQLWSPAEDEIVIEAYRDGVRIAGIVNLLATKGFERNRQAVQMRAIALGISGDRVNYWTEQEKAISVAGLTAGKPYREILEDLRKAGFHRGSTALFKFAQQNNFNRGADPWTPDEMAILRERYAAKVGCKEIAEELGKTAAAIRTVACKLGLKQRIAWSDQERQILIDSQGAGETLVKAAEKIGRPYVNVARMAANLQLDFRQGRKAST